MDRSKKNPGFFATDRKNPEFFSKGEVRLQDFQSLRKVNVETALWREGREKVAVATLEPSKDSRGKQS